MLFFFISYELSYFYFLYFFIFTMFYSSKYYCRFLPLKPKPCQPLCSCFCFPQHCWILLQLFEVPHDSWRTSSSYSTQIDISKYLTSKCWSQKSHMNLHIETCSIKLNLPQTWLNAQILLGTVISNASSLLWEP